MYSLASSPLAPSPLASTTPPGEPPPPEPTRPSPTDSASDRYPDGHPEACPDLRQLADVLASQSMEELQQHNAPPWVEACGTCRANRDQLDHWMDTIGYPDYRIAAHEYPLAQGLWHQLRGLSTDELAMRIEMNSTFVFWSFARLLVDRSEEVQAADPARALILAQAAVSLTTLLDPQTYLPDLVAELQTCAWLRLSDARRLAGQFDVSYNELLGAHDRMARSPKSALCQARYAELLGTLLSRHARGNVRGIAARELRFAAELYEQAGLDAERGRVELRLGSLHQFGGAWDDAILHLTQALHHLPRTDDPALYLHCLLRLASVLRSAGQQDEAQLRLETVAHLLRQLARGVPASVDTQDVSRR